jgi:hypothetical protein
MPQTKACSPHCRPTQSMSSSDFFGATVHAAAWIYEPPGALD